MQRTMGNYICLNNIIITILTTLIFVGCKPAEPMLELQLEEQAIEQAFSFADYCEEEYDSIYLIQPYDDENKIYSLPYKMSQRLREKCSYTTDDTFVRLLFIYKGTVKAYSEVGCSDASFSAKEFTENGPIYSFIQKFILDDKRYVHLYNE